MIELFNLSVISARIFGLFVGLPLGDALQAVPRLFISILFAFALGTSAKVSECSSLLVLIPEFVAGLIIAAPVRFLTESAEMFGELLDTARGQTIGSIVDPLNQQQSSDMATFSRLVVLNVAIQLGLFDRAICAVLESYEVLPAGTLFSSDIDLFSLAIGSVSVVAIALRFSAVWLVAYLITDITSALLAKVSHGLNFTSLATVLKMALTFILLLNLTSSPGEVFRIIELQLSKLSLSGS
jgi:flagellar biosynthetic protein FliR